MNSLTPIAESPEYITSLTLEAAHALHLQTATDYIAYGGQVQHLSVREEERYQRSIRRMRRIQMDSWLNGILIPSTDDATGRENVYVYLLEHDRAHRVGRLRHSMTEPIFGQLKNEFDTNQRVVPVIAKVAPGRSARELGIIAYAKTDLVDFPAY